MDAQTIIMEMEGYFIKSTGRTSSETLTQQYLNTKSNVVKIPDK